MNVYTLLQDDNMNYIIKQLESQVDHYESLASTYRRDIESYTKKIEDAQALAKQYRDAITKLKQS